MITRQEKEVLRVEYEIRRDWIEKMNKILGYDNSDGFHSEPDPFTIAENIVNDYQAMDRRVAQCEYAVELLTWFQSNRYAHLIHRHDGSFRAVDEALNVSWETDRLELLASLIKDNPVTERAP